MRHALLLVCVPILTGCCFAPRVTPECRATCTAAEQGDLATLGAHTADLQCRDADGYQPIHYAAAQGRTEAVSWLLDHGAPVESGGLLGRTAFYEAIKYGRIETAQMLLDRGANIEMRAETGHTPWLVAAERGELGSLQFLLDHGAETRVVNGDQSDALYLYVRRSPEPSVDGVRFLLEHGGVIDLHDENGESALIGAIGRDREDIARLLLDAGANPNIESNRALTPLGFASAHHPSLVPLLTQYGARTNPVFVDEPPALSRSLEIPAIVTFSGGARPIPVDSRCTLHVRPADAGYFNCQITIDCENGARLYGGPRTGFTQCEETPAGARAFDWGISPRDGDPSVELDEGARRLSVDDGMPGLEGTHVRFRLEPADAPAAP